MVDYIRISETPGKLYFDCEPLRSRLSVDACADSWRRANSANDGSRIRCKGCALGSQHAGEANASLSSLRNSRVCARCHRGATRLIGGNICVSCYNRGREFVKGCNAKGTPVVKLRDLLPRQLLYRQGASVQCLRLARAVDTTELLVTALRDAPKTLQFGLARRTAYQPMQAQLWG